jgi:hypothetical protein
MARPKRLDIDLGPIIALYESHRRVEKEGVSYGGLESEDLITVLETCLEVSSDTPGAEKYEMIQAAVRATSHTATINQKRVA